MEEARLARLGKRKRSASPDRPSKQVSKQTEPTTLDGIRYPKGAIKRSWAYKFPRTDDISIEEVLQAPTLNIAVLSSFQWDDKWIFHKADPKKIKQLWIIGANTDAIKQEILQELAECNTPNVKPHFPPMRTTTTMHSKLMLLFHDTHLRIVVPTANLKQVEWGETGKDPKSLGSWQPAVLENTVFLIDLPRRPDGVIAEKLETAFGQSLIEFLEAQEVGKKVVEGLRKFDFSETNQLAFVHSISGTHSKGPRRSDTGLPGLATAIRQLNLHNVERLELDYASSSIGGLKEEFLQKLYLAASGVQPLGNKAPEGWSDRFRVYFPTRDTVINSTGGVDCGGVITLNSRSCNAPSFARQCLRTHTSTRTGLLSHNKMLLARGYKNDGTPFAWAYVGSANATESAWGSQSVLKSGKEGALKVNNWECGVVVPVPAAKLQGLGGGEIPPMSVFQGTVEVPFKFPGQKYEGKQPWFFMDQEPNATR
ncbi:phospholipase D/nuclease [Karstenula rhodostoma CBS 690.94]|uniref:Phospholipase D/nuclease n=1 Tax=Karstenula rhodostoma CBS 690.94 TaxID=1392251 RepID=A0A9P4PV64_9PLEO|nr:phospholipase D/nuclease [Karstenula rhodostoma CBS 690.94]